MKATIVLDTRAAEELEELSELQKTSKSEIIREALNEFYLKEKRARENFRFFIDLYSKGIIMRDTLFLMLPEKDAEAIIGGVKIGKEAANLAKKCSR